MRNAVAALILFAIKIVMQSVNITGDLAVETAPLCFITWVLSVFRDKVRLMGTRDDSRKDV